MKARIKDRSDDGKNSISSFSQLDSGCLLSIEASILSVDVYVEKKDKYIFMGISLPKISVEIEDSKHLRLTLFLWGRQYEWLEKCRRNLGSLASFKNVFLKESLHDHSVNTLHTTPS